MTSTTDARPAWIGVSPAGPWRLRFAVFWWGQFTGLTGLALAMFAIGVYVYSLYPSVVMLGFLMSLPIVPFVVSSPFAGALVDRWGAQRSLLVSNVLGLVNLLVLVMFDVTGLFATGRVTIFLWTAAAIKALHLAAFETAVPFLVPEQQLGRANGGRMALAAVGALLGPVLAAPLMLALGFGGVVVMGCATFGLSILSLLFVRVPSIPEAARTRESSTLFKEFREAVGYLRGRRQLAALMLVLAAVNAGIGAAELLLTQLTLSFATFDSLNAILLVGTVGLLVGTLWVVITGRPRRHARGVTIASLILATAMVFGGLSPNVFLLATAAFLFLGCASVIIGMIQTISQLEVEPSYFGRTAAIRSICIDGPYMLAQTTLGVVAAYVFLPLVGEEEVRFDVLALLVGSGPGRGFALLMILLGGLLAAFVLVTVRRSSLLSLDQERPGDGEQDMADRRSTVRAGS